MYMWIKHHGLPFISNENARLVGYWRDYCLIVVI